MSAPSTSPCVIVARSTFDKPVFYPDQANPNKGILLVNGKQYVVLVNNVGTRNLDTDHLANIAVNTFEFFTAEKIVNTNFKLAVLAAGGYEVDSQVKPINSAQSQAIAAKVMQQIADAPERQANSLISNDITTGASTLAKGAVGGLAGTLSASLLGIPAPVAGALGSAIAKQGGVKSLATSSAAGLVGAGLASLTGFIPPSVGMAIGTSIGPSLLDGITGSLTTKATNAATSYIKKPRTTPTLTLPLTSSGTATTTSSTTSSTGTATSTSGTSTTTSSLSLPALTASTLVPTDQPSLKRRIAVGAAKGLFNLGKGLLWDLPKKGLGLINPRKSKNSISSTTSTSSTSSTTSTMTSGTKKHRKRKTK